MQSNPTPIYMLSDRLGFPPPRLASREGLLAVGGDLSLERLILAYRNGIFPWYSDGEPILWWSPDPRLVLYPSNLKISKSLNKTIRKKQFHITMDTAFNRVIEACAHIHRRHDRGTWITREMIRAYQELHTAGYAHSVEAWHDGILAGGLYGVSLGGSFFGESMFTKISNASKVALAALCGHLGRLAFDLIDCQVSSLHLMRMGAGEIGRNRFLDLLAVSMQRPDRIGKWRYGGSGDQGVNGTGGGKG